MSRVIAVVDNNQMIRDFVASVLSLAGYTLRVFESGCDFLCRHDSDDSGAVTGVTVSGLDGFSTLQQMRGAGMGVPVLLMAGCLPTYEEVRACDAEFLELPFRPTELREAARRAFGAPEDFECDEPLIVQAGT